MIGTEPSKDSGRLKVTFALPPGDVHGQVAVVGDFNGWNPTTDPLEPHDGWLKATVEVEPGCYRFRYLAEDGHWFNDAEVGVYEPNGMGDDNSLLDLSPDGDMSADPDDRLDLHNSSVDKRMAEAHLCGTYDLRTGRTCIKPVHHHGTCEFIPVDSALHATAASA